MPQQLTILPTFDAWQKAARHALGDELPPAELIWEPLTSPEPGLGLFDEHDGRETNERPATATSRHRVPKAFVTLARRVACHRDPTRWALLYRVLWRLTHGEAHLLEVRTDPDVDQLFRHDKAIGRALHKMRAFVRFRAVEHEGATWHVAWFEPEHAIVELNAPFFVDRFAGMRWSILTPDRSAHWDGANLTFTAGVPKSEAPTEDAVEDLWLTYYRNIFNPARVKTHAMQAEMPKKYWKNLPEAAAIPGLLMASGGRVNEMLEASERKRRPTVAHSLAPAPTGANVPTLRQAAAACTACPLYRDATQTVFGEGPENARLVFVGEQPGDNEDLLGHPFIGPAGQLFDRALAEVGIDRQAAYLTNAVKHFKWTPRGKRRLHAKPSARDIAACRPWLEAELAAIRPAILVCLGGTAAQSLLGSSVRVLRDRGQFRETEWAPHTLITVHPSSLLRAPTEEARAEGYAAFLADLIQVRDALGAGG
ncbi:MAG: UdgX family uracil-DNA binding protein [Chthoniobacterales bacterium]